MIKVTKTTVAHTREYCLSSREVMYIAENQAIPIEQTKEK